ncbi:hypothetical protein KPH14_004446 [Odynerus spinipes]|uniref:Protein prenyltransferase alpha subunit repeat-containing protein 1 n=1 Tax=Odynerus spinipes TaxID=1348599 RepID=A0AAD9RYU2_9HYME|nr:hypothetical protein KPH14_004446 [Odynerus spinipes]
MQEDTFPAAEKILSDIENVLKKDTSLKSFEIVPAEDNENKSPVFHQEECLGLASWCVQPLYCYAYRRLLEHRRNRHRREDPSNVARWLLGALLLNPDVATFWNMRRELVRCHKLDASEELAFTRLVLHQKPKCFEAFAYRRWLLPYILDAKGKNYDPIAAESPLCAEADVARTCADRYANNYHAWSHRRYVMTLRESRGYTHPTLEAEWKSSLAWCQRHVSDYSGHAYRQFLLRKCVLETEASSKEDFLEYTNTADYRQRCDAVLAYVSGVLSENPHEKESEDSTTLTRDDTTCRTLDMLHGKSHPGCTSRLESQACFHALSYWIEESMANEDSIRMYNDHEALWCHRRYLAHLLLRLVESYKMYSTYKAGVVDDSCRIRPLELGDNVDGRNESKGNNIQAPLVKAFLDRTREIVELARKRDAYERILVERFQRFLGNIGLEL